MDELIQQAFAHVDVVGPAVRAGRFDLIGPTGEMILKAVWENTIEPDWTITMSMWPVPERPPMHHGALPERPGSRHGNRHGVGGRGPPPPPNGHRGPIVGGHPGPGPSNGRMPIPPMYGEQIRGGGSGPQVTVIPDRPGRSSSRSKSKKSTSSPFLGFLAGSNPKKSSSSGKGVLNFFSCVLT